MGCAIFHNVTQLFLYVELSLRMDRVGATWPVAQVASPCKLPGQSLTLQTLELLPLTTWLQRCINPKQTTFRLSVCFFFPPLTQNTQTESLSQANIKYQFTLFRHTSPYLEKQFLRSSCVTSSVHRPTKIFLFSKSESAAV